MTTEQAKSELMQIYGMLSEEKKQALDVLMAQADGDAVSRQAMLDAITEVDEGWNMDIYTNEVREIVNQLPSVAIPSAEPREVLYSGDGYADGYMVYDMAECPNCGREFEDDDETWKCNFCPDCGQALDWEGEHDEADN